MEAKMIAIVCLKCRRTKRFGEWIKLTKEQWLDYRRQFEIREEIITCPDCLVKESKKIKNGGEEK